MSPKPKGGVNEAARLLAGLDHGDREKVLELIFKQDPQMAELLKKNLVLFEDLRYLTPKMIQDLLREIDLSDLSLALRLASEDLRKHFLSNVTSRVREEIEEVLNGGPQSVAKIHDCHDKIMTKVRKLMEKGVLVIDRDGSEKLV